MLKKIIISIATVIMAVLLVNICSALANNGHSLCKIEKDGTLYDGRALFKFSIVSDSTTLWSNDGTGIKGTEPLSAIEEVVKQGIFAIELGGPSMKPIYYELLDNFPDPFLRIWINTGQGFKQLSDRPLSGSGVSFSTDGSCGSVEIARADVSSKPFAPLIRSPKVFEEKISRRKKAKKNKQSAQNPEGLARERYLKRADENGNIPMDALIRAKKHIDRMRSQEVHIMDAGLWSWEWLGPGNIGGRIRSILIHPVNPARMWVGSVSGGIWTTNNGGGSWSAVDDFMPSLSISSLVYDPTNPNIMYAGTGEGFCGRMDRPGAGIFRSTDGGVTWNQLPSTNNYNFRWVNRLAHHPTAANRIFAVTRSIENVIGIPTIYAVQESTDGGNTWNIIHRTASFPTDIKIHPTATNRILVGCNSDVYYSSDGGSTWNHETSGLPGKMPDADSGRCEVAFSASNSSVMYVSMDRNEGEVWRTTNSGSNWQLRNTGTRYFRTSSGGNQGCYDNAIWVDPTNSDFIVVGGINIWRSTDGGTNLTEINHFRYYHEGTSAHADQHAIVHHPGYNGSTNRAVYFGNDGGIQMAQDISTVSPTSGWVNLAHNLGITQFYGGAAAPDGSVIVGGTQDNDKLRYTPSGGTGGWYQCEQCVGDGGFAAVDYNDTSIIYGEYVSLEIQKSTDGGDSYFRATNGLLDVGGNALFIAPFVMDPNDSTVLIAGGRSIWRTTDSAANWAPIRSPGVPAPTCSAIDIAKSDSNIIWVGYSDGQVSRTTDGGNNWIDVDGNPTALPNRHVSDIAINPSDSSEVFVTFSGFNTDNVWQTTDSGANWIQRTGTAPYDLPALTVNTIRFHPVEDEWIYIGTDLGVLASEDKGERWSVTPRYIDNEGPVNVEVDELFWQGTEYLIAATHGRGMYRCRPLTVIYVDGNAAPGGDGSYLHPFQTVTEAVNAALHGTTISIETGNYNETITLYKRGKIVVTNGPAVIGE